MDCELPLSKEEFNQLIELLSNRKEEEVILGWNETEDGFVFQLLEA